MWICPICGTENSVPTVCSCCGFDGSTNNEDYPTLCQRADAPSVGSLLRENWENAQTKLERLSQELAEQGRLLADMQKQNVERQANWERELISIREQLETIRKQTIPEKNGADDSSQNELWHQVEECKQELEILDEQPKAMWWHPGDQILMR